MRRAFAGENCHAPYVIVAMHGDSGRMILAPGTAAPGLKSSFSVEEVRLMVRVPGKVVLGVGCASGTQEWADVFFEGGASDYIAPVSAPFPHAASVFTTILFYALTQGRDLAEAVETARTVDSELAISGISVPDECVTRRQQSRLAEQVAPLGRRSGRRGRTSAARG